MKKIIALFLFLIICLSGCDKVSTTSNESAVNTLIQDFDVAVSWANYSDDDKIYSHALNTDKMIISSVQHLPIYKFDTLKDLKQFKDAFGETLSMKNGYDEVPSFEVATAKYDDVFFEENTLMLVYVVANNSSHRYGVNSIFCDEKSFCIHIEETTGLKLVDTAMAGWFVTVAVADSAVTNCTEFDADLNNIEN